MRALTWVLAGMLAFLAVPVPAQGPAPAPPARAVMEIKTQPTPSARVTRQLTRDDVEAWLDGFMPYALDRGDIAGGVVVVVKDGQVLLQKGYGYADRARHIPVDPARTLFRPGSVSKLFTWTAVMQLVEQGKLDLDRDVNAYLDFKIPAYDGKPITLRNIMTHTTGFEEAARGTIGSNPKGPLPLGAYLKRWTPERIFAPGSTPAYSNYATALAGYIVQRVSGQSYDDYVDAHIFAPLGMTRSSFRQPLPVRLRPLMSNGYALGSGEPKRYEMVGPAPAGSLATTASDMARFMIAHLDHGGAILKPETTRMMHDTRLTMVPPLNRMALGFYEQNINGRTVIGHGGDTQWFHSYLWLFPDEKVGLFVSLNSTGANGAASAIRSALLDQFADRYFSATGRDGRVDAVTAAQHARLMVGTYTNSRRSHSNLLKALELVGQVKIGLDAKGGLVTDFIPGLGNQPRRWVEIAPFVWRDANSHERLAAKVIDGKVVRLSFDQVSPFMVFEPVPWYLSNSWLLPAVLLSMTVLLLTALSWPIAAIARRRYQAQHPFAGTSLKAYRFVRGFAGLVVIVLVGWAATLGAMLADFDLLGGKLDALVWLLQIASLVAFVGLPAIALWNLWLTWAGKRGWFSKLWSVAILFAATIALWAALAFNLIGFGTNY